MALIPCENPCRHQRNGICTLDTVTEPEGFKPSDYDCVHFTVRDENKNNYI